MDWTSIVISLAILAYGWTAYVRRENKHRKMLEILKKGEELPVVARKISTWRLVTTGGMVLFLLLVAAGFLWLGIRGSGKYALPFVVMSVASLPPAVLLGMIWWRDYDFMRSSAGQRKGASQ